MQEFEIDGDYIELVKLLKASAIIGSGGIAGMIIKDGEITVNGEIEIRKKAKIRKGSIVEFDGGALKVI